ncbi:MAG: hypothetical protein J7578_23655 [Chitinophagaceae bacterium]|nr:hypothetical protein [Chitinophagaceae bacterium]
MKPFYIFPLILLVAACHNPKGPGKRSITRDTALRDKNAIPMNGNTEADPLADARYMDSFFSVKPVAVFISDKTGDGLQKLTASFIDTTGIILHPLVSQKKSVRQIDKDSLRYSYTWVKGQQRFNVQVIRPAEAIHDDPRKILINGKLLRPGLELDTSLVDSGYEAVILIDSAILMTFGSKEYLYLTGHVDDCNGIGCSLFYNILYDPAAHKGMIAQQFRSDLTMGYDRENDQPVFIYNEGYNDMDNQLRAVLLSGKVYSWNAKDGVKPFLNRKKQQLQFEGYFKYDNDSIFMTRMVMQP